VRTLENACWADRERAMGAECVAAKTPPLVRFARRDVMCSGGRLYHKACGAGYWRLTCTADPIDDEFFRSFGRTIETNGYHVVRPLLPE